MTEITEPQQVSCLIVSAAPTHARRLAALLTRFPENADRSRALAAAEIDSEEAEEEALLRDLLGSQAYVKPSMEYGNTGKYDTQIRVADLEEALTAVSEQLFDAIFIDFCSQGDDPSPVEPLSIIDEFSREAPGVSLIVVLSDDQNHRADKLVERGATDYVLESELALSVVNRVLRYALSRKQSTNQIFRLLHFDDLTGLSNRHLCYDRISQAMIRAERSGQNVAVLLIDLDNFRGINETLGYEVGDFLLKETARRLVSCVRRQDTVSRFGSDEFVMVLEGLNDPQHATVIAKQILQNFSEPAFNNQRPIFISMSIGISVSEPELLDARALLKQADIARYRAKESGGSNFQYFVPSLNAEAQRRLTLERELNHALKKIFTKKSDPKNNDHPPQP